MDMNMNLGIRPTNSSPYVRKDDRLLDVKVIENAK